MSSSTVCQGLWSCLEPRQAHPLVALKIVSRWVCSSPPPSPWDTQPSSLGRRYDCKEANGAPNATNIDAAISKPIPLLSFSYCRPSEKSLELCTETLGCETGAMYSANEVMDELSPSGQRNHHHAREKMIAKKKKSSLRSEFPPPLTTLCGDWRLRMVSTREEGRLRLTPTVPSRLLKAHRVDGHLRLRLLFPKPFQPPQADLFDQIHQEEEEEQVEEKEELNSEEGHVDDEELEQGRGGYISKSKGDGGGEDAAKGGGKFARAGRCKEEQGGGGHGHGRGGSGNNPMMVNLKAFWVASS